MRIGTYPISSLFILTSASYHRCSPIRNSKIIHTNPFSFNSRFKISSRMLTYEILTQRPVGSWTVVSLGIGASTSVSRLRHTVRYWTPTKRIQRRKQLHHCRTHQERYRTLKRRLLLPCRMVQDSCDSGASKGVLALRCSGARPILIWVRLATGRIVAPPA